ncbi:MAG: hypothetical protein R3E32_15255 [Chitinophagales bacterium]
MLIRFFLVFTITLLSISTGIAQTKSGTSTPEAPTSKVEKNAEIKAKLQRNLDRSSTTTATRYNPNMAQRAFMDMAKDANKNAVIINGYELEFNSSTTLEGSQSVANIVLYASGEKFGDIMFFGRDEMVESVQKRMGDIESLEKSIPIMLAYHIDMLPNILSFLKSSPSAAVVLDKTTSRVSLSSGKVNMWENR